jgi:signal peptide peptidase-like protein 2B
MFYSFSWSQHAAQTYVKIPFFGAVSYLTLAVTPFCIAFAVVWGVKRRVSYAWIGQDILVRIVLLLSRFLFGQISFSFFFDSCI